MSILADSALENRSITPSCSDRLSKIEWRTPGNEGNAEMSEQKGGVPRLACQGQELTLGSGHHAGR